MSTFLISCLGFALLLAGSCSSHPPAAANNAVSNKGPWSLSLTTSGGFGGMGKGNFSVGSEGNYKCEETNRQAVRKGVMGKLTAGELQPFSDAVAGAQPKDWNKAELKIAAPDAFGYKLELHTGPPDANPFTVEWYDNTADKLPVDLKKLSDAIDQT